jgi:hypothetical protein
MIDLSRAHANNPFRQPRYVPASEIYTDPRYPMTGSRWLGFGPGPSKVDTEVVHYPGSRLGALQLSTKVEDVIARLRASNASSWEKRGYALYYSFDLPTDGSLYGIREFNFRNAANADDDKSDGNENDWSFAVHTMLQKLFADNSDTTVEPTWDQLETLRWLRWEAREYGIEETGNELFEIHLLPHRYIKPTGCPGDKMTIAINNGVLNIPARSATPPQEPPVTTGKTDLIIVDYGFPGVDFWWTRCVIAGDGFNWVQGQANEWTEPDGTHHKLEELASAHVQVANDQHFLDLLATYKARTAPPWTIVPTSTWAGNPTLRDAWMASIARAG